MSANSTTINAWNPCLEEQEAGDYNQLLTRINQTVLNRLSNKGSEKNLSPGIMTGSSGAILYLFHAALHQKNEELYTQAMVNLEQLMEEMDSMQGPSLCDGVSGLIWLLLYLQREEILDTEEDLISEELLDSLCEGSLQMIQQGNYDYMHQGLGLTTALLCSRDYTLRYQRYLEQVVEALDGTAKKWNDNSVYWEFLLNPERKGKVSLGICHGMPSILAVLAKISAAGICSELCNSLVEKTAGFLITHRNKEAMPSLYPTFVEPGDSPPFPASRFGWCYGDMGVAAGFIQAAKATSLSRYRHEAAVIIAAIQDREDAGRAMAGDATFCHGAWGIAHLFNRLYNYNSDPGLKEKACYWLRRALKLTRSGKETVTMQVLAGELMTESDGPTVLNGLAGAGLTILSAVAPLRPAWDEIFFLDFN